VTQKKKQEGGWGGDTKTWGDKGGHWGRSWRRVGVVWREEPVQGGKQWLVRMVRADPTKKKIPGQKEHAHRHQNETGADRPRRKVGGKRGKKKEPKNRSKGGSEGKTNAKTPAKEKITEPRKKHRPGRTWDSGREAPAVRRTKKEGGPTKRVAVLGGS